MSLTHSIPIGAQKQITYMSFLPTPYISSLFQLELIKRSTHMTNSSAFSFPELMMLFHNKSSLRAFTMRWIGVYRTPTEMCLINCALSVYKFLVRLWIFHSVGWRWFSGFVSPLIARGCEIVLYVRECALDINCYGRN